MFRVAFPFSPHPGEFLPWLSVVFYSHEPLNRELQRDGRVNILVLSGWQSYEQVSLSLESSHSLGDVGTGRLLEEK